MSSILITGAARGIGRASTLRFAAAGWDVHAGVRSEADGEALVAAAPTGHITPVLLDVTDAEQIARLPDVLPSRLDAVVNNAGIVVGGPVETVAIDDVRRQLEVNVVGPLAVAQATLPLLRVTRGRLVFVSSVGGRVSSPMTGVYAASKYAIEALADALRMELRPWGVHVALIEPGAIDTDMWRTALETADAVEAGMAPEHRALYQGHIDGARPTLKRIQKSAVSPDKVAAAIEKAVVSGRPRSRYVVGVDARVQLLVHALPTRAGDAAFAKLAGVPPAP